MKNIVNRLFSKYAVYICILNDLSIVSKVSNFHVLLNFKQTCISHSLFNLLSLSVISIHKNSELSNVRKDIDADIQYKVI
uniref:Uncharacterized protein n=1 Tax=Schistosoma mansoni TaxID=6183 RepID=A0A5K4F4I3_SCHMA